MRLRRAARMRHGAEMRRPDELRVFPQRAGIVVGPARLPGGAARGDLRLRHQHVDAARPGVDDDPVAVLQQRDRPADGRFRPDMADAEAARRAGEPPIGDQRHLLAHALAVDRRGGGQHLAHAGAALRALVADDDDVAGLVGARIDRGEGFLLAVEAQRGALEAQGLHAGDLHDRRRPAPGCPSARPRRRWWRSPC